MSGAKSGSPAKAKRRAEPMTLTIPSTFTADTVEQDIVSVEQARQLAEQTDPAILAFVAERRRQFEECFGDGEHQDLLDRAEVALTIALARFATRHGRWGKDFHDYHNEGHAREIVGRRLDRLCSSDLSGELVPEDWVLLALFGGFHDLRQREERNVVDGIGANERASMAEARRIMTTAGFSSQDNPEFFQIMDMMIAGSTFEVAATPNKSPSLLTPPERAASGGALAPKLIDRMARKYPDWRNNAALVRRARLTRIASDLDTANVGERFAEFAASAVRLCREVENRLGRGDMGPESAASVFHFLTAAQENYFFNLHNFDSRIGLEVFGTGKRANAPRLRRLVKTMQKRFADRLDEVTGEEIAEAFMQEATKIGERV